MILSFMDLNSFLNKYKHMSNAATPYAIECMAPLERHCLCWILGKENTNPSEQYT